MALGIRGYGFSPIIEANKVTFRQKGGVELSLSGSDVTGASSAPEFAIMTVCVPPGLKKGKAEVLVSNSFVTSNPLVIEISDAAPCRFDQLETEFASEREPVLLPEKLLVIGGHGFAFKEDENSVLFEWEDKDTKVKKVAESKPSEVRGDALLGVEVPSGMENALVTIKVTTRLGGADKGTESNSRQYLSRPAPLLERLGKPYVRPGESLRLFGFYFDAANKQHNHVILRSYEAKEPVVCKVTQALETELLFRIPTRPKLPSGPVDVKVEVHGVRSRNSLLLDMQSPMSWWKRRIWTQVSKPA